MQNFLVETGPEGPRVSWRTNDQAPPSGRYIGSPYSDRLSFAGNIYAGDISAEVSDQPFEDFCRSMEISKKVQFPLASSWHALLHSLESLDFSERVRAHFDFDSYAFWQFADRLIRQNCNMIARSSVLTSVKMPISLYGEFAPGSSVSGLSRFSNLVYRGFVDFASDLPQVYAKSDILVDVTNAAFISNCSSKPVCCFAAGGFALFDRKADVVKFVGDEISRVMYVDTEDLNAKIDYFLTFETERRDLARHLQEAVTANCDFSAIVHGVAHGILKESVGRRSWLSFLSFWRNFP